MAHLHLRLFGSPQVELNGTSIDLVTRKVMALLAYLTVTGQPHSRDTLATLFWPESDQARARGSLRHALAALREALGAEWLETQGEAVRLRQGVNFTVDVTRFLHLVGAAGSHGHREDELCPACVAPLSEAAALYHGDFLSGFSLSNSPAFDEWQYFQSEHLRHHFAGVLERLVEYHTGRREWEQATSYAQRWVAFDPLHEAAQRQLMQLYTWAGRRTAALRQYRACERVLQEELGVSPAQETVRLFAAIRAGQISVPLPLSPPPVAQPEQATSSASEVSPHEQNTSPLHVAHPVFVAREAEMMRLAGYLAQALSGQGQVVFVTGEAGSGKTMLLQEFAHRALTMRADLLVATGNCNSFTGTGDAYLPFREVIQQFTGDIDADVAGILPLSAHSRQRQALPSTAMTLLQNGPGLIGAFVPAATVLAHATHDVTHQLNEIMTRNERSGGTLNQEQMVEQVTRTLVTLALQHPLLLILDDLHWADAASIGLLFHLARRIDQSRILLVGAYRPHEVALGRGGEHHPLAQVMNELQRYLGDIRIDLDLAGDITGVEFVNALLDSETNRLSAAFRAGLYERTEGHPLFTVEMLRGLQERGQLFRDAEGYWVEGAHLDWDALPIRVEGIISERIARLDGALIDALTIASVEGESFIAEVLAHVQGVEAQKMIRLLSEELDRRHKLVRAVGTGQAQGRRLSRYRLRHFLFQRYLYHQLDPNERASMHEEVAAALEILYDEQTDEIALELAQHFSHAKKYEKAVYYWLLAAKHALTLHAYDAAISHGQQGLTLLQQVTSTPESRRYEFDIQIILASALAALKGYAHPEVRHAYTRAYELVLHADEPGRQVQALSGLVRFHMLRGEIYTSSQLAKQLLTLAESLEDPDLLLVARRAMGGTQYYLGHFNHACEHFSQAIALYDAQRHNTHAFLYAQDTGVVSLSESARALWFLGYAERSLQTNQAAVTLAQELAHPVTLAFAMFLTAFLHLLRREEHVVRQQAEETAQYCEQYGIKLWSAWARILSGWAQSAQGELQQGILQMEQSIHTARATESWLLQPYYLALLAKAYIRANRFEAAASKLNEAIKILDINGEHLWEAELHRLQGVLMLALPQAQPTEAEKEFERAIAVAQRQQAKMWELRATVSLCQLWQRQGRQGAAYARLAAVYHWFTEGYDTPDLRKAKALLTALNAAE